MLSLSKAVVIPPMSREWGGGKETERTKKIRNIIGHYLVTQLITIDI